MKKALRSLMYGFASIGEGMASILSFGQYSCPHEPLSDEEAFEADRTAIESDWKAVMGDWETVWNRYYGKEK